MHVCRYVYIYMYHYAHRTFYLCCSFTLLMYLVLCCVPCSILCSILSAGTLDVCIRLGHFMSARSKGRSPIIIIIIITGAAVTARPEVSILSLWPEELVLFPFRYGPESPLVNGRVTDFP